MRKFTAAAAAVIVFAAPSILCPAALAQKKQQPPRPKPAPAARRPAQGIVITRPDLRPDAGQVAGQIYTNKFFGLSMTFPDGWLILSESGKADIMEGGKQFITGTPAERVQLERSLARTHNLFSLMEGTPAQAGQVPASLMCVAETLPVVNMTAGAYLKVMRDMMMPRMSAQGLRYEVADDISPERLGGAEFAALRFKVTTPTGEGWQEYHVAIKGGHALGFILTYASDSQRSAMRGALDSIKFVK